MIQQQIAILASDTRSFDVSDFVLQPVTTARTRNDCQAKLIASVDPEGIHTAMLTGWRMPDASCPKTVFGNFGSGSLRIRQLQGITSKSELSKE